jgi:hypothetical protein
MPGSERQVVGVCLRLVWQGNGSKVCRCQGMDFWDNLDDRKSGDTQLTPLSPTLTPTSTFEPVRKNRPD